MLLPPQLHVKWKTTCCWCILTPRFLLFPGLKISLRPFLAEFIGYGLAEDVLRPYYGHYGLLLVCRSAPRDDSTQRGTDRPTDPPGYLSILQCGARMKHRSPSEQHHGKRSRVPAAAASTSQQDGMEDKTPQNPRELTQNPLKKIWMPCKNGLPEKHISQRKGAYDNVAAMLGVCARGLMRRSNRYL